MNILIPMVLSNTLIQNNGGYIKQLIEINKKTILEHIYNRLKTINNAKFIFIVHSADVKNYHIDNIIKLLEPEANIVVAQGDTRGSACSCLLAINYIDSDDPLLIVGADQIIDADLSEIVGYFTESTLDAGTVIFADIHPKWSYVLLDENDLVVEAAEKNPISRNASAGYYYFKSGKTFVNAAMQMILKRETTNNQYYICPVFNEMVLDNRKIGVYRIEKSNYYSLTSEQGIAEFEAFINNK